MKILFDERNMASVPEDAEAIRDLVDALHKRAASGETIVEIPAGCGQIGAMFARMRAKPDIIHSCRGVRRVGFARHLAFHKPGVDSGRFRPLAPDDAAQFRFRKHLPEKYLLVRGPDTPERNLKTLIAAMNEMDSTETLPLVVTGVGRRDPLQREIEKRRLEDSVFLAGAVTPEERPLYIAAAALYLDPGLADCPLGVLEAMACGTPVLASALPHSRALFGGAAKLVHAKDPKEWARALRAAQFSLEWRENASRRGIEMAASHSWPMVAEELLRQYRRLLSKRLIRLGRK